MKKRIYYFYIILIFPISFINQERIAFAETVNTPTNEYLNQKKDKRCIEAKDSEIYAGDLWNPEDNFVSATDEDGNPIYWGDSRITWTGTVDVSKPGINEIEYRITRNGNVIRSKVK
ncbi:bacterial Ig-like domain-containing protein, partial [Enterococcus faecalis]|uniref:bacterial Ig-like domain-containing protein n=1 Tax=Enterococcus faecalis TaxID=1351 RepID=UPI0031735AFE